MLLAEATNEAAANAGPGEVNNGEKDRSSSDGEHEEDQCLSLSSAASSTDLVSPETPMFQTKATLGSSPDLMQLANHAAQEEASSSLLNGRQYETDLQLQSSASYLNDGSVNSPLHNNKKTSYLQDHFPAFDEPAEEHAPTLEDGSDDSSSSPQEKRSLLSSKADTFNVGLSASHSSEGHPLLRSSKKSKSTVLSNLSIPQKAKPAAPSHQKTNSVLEEEGDYYPNPDDFPAVASSSFHNKPDTTTTTTTSTSSLQFTPYYTVTKYLQTISQTIMRSPQQYDPTAAASWIGFWALFLVTCSNYVLMPMRDAIALAVGVEHIPKLTLASTVLALFSSVPIGWLFEAPDPQKRRMWKQIGLTRGETQGTSLALFYRLFAMSLISYAIGFRGIEFLVQFTASNSNSEEEASSSWLTVTIRMILQHLGKAMYIAFFLVVHLMKLHSLSLVWGVTTEAMEYEENGRKRLLAKQQKQSQQSLNSSATTEGQDPSAKPPTSRTRLQRLAFVGFGGTVGGILGSMIASSLANVLKLSGLLVVSALMLEAAAQLAIELGRIMHVHWLDQQQNPSSEDLASLDPSMKRSASLGSMKRISSGNSLSRVKSMSELKSKQLGSSGSTTSSLASLEQRQKELEKQIAQEQQQSTKDDSFSQRFVRGIRTILQSRLLMSIFTYNALYASTTVLLSFQRAELVANRSAEITKEANTAFLANINMASSVAVFALQASGLGAYVAHLCGSRGTLALMPLVRLLGVFTLAYWHQTSNGEPPNLLLFLMLDECCRVMNMAVAKPVRESLWRGLSNEARYEAKPIVDTLANRWGGGSAAFLVSSLNKLLDLFGIPDATNGEARVVFGFPPVLFLCMIVATWWAGVSADLGQIRRRIDLELKKMQ